MFWWPFDDCHDRRNGVVLRRMESKLDLMNRRIECIMSTIAEIQAAVARNKDAEDSVIALLNGISQQLKDVIAAGGDPVAMQAIVDELDANTDKLAEAVVANTPQEDPPQEDTP